MRVVVAPIVAALLLLLVEESWVEARLVIEAATWKS
jgi:hypothetical protein